ncbi:beta-ketoacyl-ACP reductase [Curtobacterium sp. MCBD17_034]|nr:beta-ketoacyl-ACP reductase [Curtobacterium sp. MCBD17_034]PZF60720.1 beta-ketoacyl-ACP reductase [Curtobacterium sp. MCBD17_013]PZM32791.1 beta-ketoacyl-ACP reductase [Curtobacterium sp. MCBD17_031]
MLTRHPPRTNRTVADNRPVQTDVEPLSVIVFGASRGIGAATATAFLEAGHRVVGTHRGSGVPSGVVGVEADMRDEGSVADAVRTAVEHGRLDVAVVNAAVAPQELLVRMTAASIREVLEVNLVGAMLATKHVAKAMNRQRSGSIVLVSSESARVGIPGSSHYTASKAALEGFMRSVMWEYGPRGIRINAVAPGPTETDMLAPMTDEHRRALLERIPLGRVGRPDEIADVIRWVAQSTFLNGAVVPVTGGEGFGV